MSKWLKFVFGNYLLLDSLVYINFLCALKEALFTRHLEPILPSLEKLFNMKLWKLVKVCLLIKEISILASSLELDAAFGKDAIDW